MLSSSVLIGILAFTARDRKSILIAITTLGYVVLAHAAAHELLEMLARVPT